LAAGIGEICCYGVLTVIRIMKSTIGMLLKHPV